MNFSEHGFVLPSVSLSRQSHNSILYCFCCITTVLYKLVTYSNMNTDILIKNFSKLKIIPYKIDIVRASIFIQSALMAPISNFFLFITLKMCFKSNIHTLYHTKECSILYVFWGGMVRQIFMHYGVGIMTLFTVLKWIQT